jgi:hypothetical protein
LVPVKDTNIDKNKQNIYKNTVLAIGLAVLSPSRIPRVISARENYSAAVQTYLQAISLPLDQGF